MYIPLKNRLWTTVAFLHCCNLIWGLANNIYTHYFYSVFDWQWQFTFVLYFNSLAIYSWTIEQIDRDILHIEEMFLGCRALTTFKLEGEVTSLSESSQGEVRDNREQLLEVVCETNTVRYLWIFFRNIHSSFLLSSYLNDRLKYCWNLR
jgi:hypothetical protein